MRDSVDVLVKKPSRKCVDCAVLRIQRGAHTSGVYLKCRTERFPHRATSLRLGRMKNGKLFADECNGHVHDLLRRKGSALELRQIRYFVAIYETGSVTKASARVLVAQSALSQQLAHLEDDVGVQLFTRTPHGVLPTAFGRMFYERSLDILHRLGDAVESVRRLAQNPNGTVSIGMPQAISGTLGLPLLQSVKLRLPDVHIRLTEDLSLTLKERLKEGRLDLAVLCDNGMNDGLSAERLLDQRFHLVSRANGDASSSVSLAEALAAPLVLPDRRDGLRIALEHVARGAGLRIADGVSEVGSLTVIKNAVLQGVAATILPLSCVGHEVENKLMQAQEIVGGQTHFTVALFMRDHALLDPATASVFRLTVDTCRELCATGRWKGAVAAGGSVQ